MPPAVRVCVSRAAALGVETPVSRDVIDLATPDPHTLEPTARWIVTGHGRQLDETVAVACVTCADRG